MDGCGREKAISRAAANVRGFHTDLTVALRSPQPAVGHLLPRHGPRGKPGLVFLSIDDALTWMFLVSGP